MSPKRNEDTFINNFHDILEAEIIQTYNDGFETIDLIIHLRQTYNIVVESTAPY